MRDRRRLITVAVAGFALAALAAHHPSADIRLMTHDLADPAPRRMQAAIDIGLASISVLYTWTARRLP